MDITFYDRYDNIIQSELSDALFQDVKAQFVYYNRTATTAQKRVFNLAKVQVPGKVMLYLRDSDTLPAFTFKTLPARANMYYVEFQVPSQQACNTIDKYTK